MSETLEAVPDSIPLASLPALRKPLVGGTFCGVVTLTDDRHYAIVKLVDRPEKALMTWRQATTWAKTCNGQLPPRAVAVLLFQLVPDLFKPTWYWTNEPHDSQRAWRINFMAGGRFAGIGSFAGGEQDAAGIMGDAAAFAVRLIPLVEPVESDAIEKRVAALEARFETQDLQTRIAALETRAAGARRG